MVDKADINVESRLQTEDTSLLTELKRLFECAKCSLTTMVLVGLPSPTKCLNQSKRVTRLTLKQNSCLQMCPG